MAPCNRGKFSADDIRAAQELYAVTDSAWLDGRSLAECVEEALQGGATFIQLREKSASTEELVELGRPLMELCRAKGIPFVIDDDIEAARILDCDGVHVGQEDESCANARAILGPDKIVGVSTQTVDEALAAQAAGADYLGVGGVVATSTKPEAWALSHQEFVDICNAADIPVVAIGGVKKETLPLLEDTGVAGVAVVSAIFAADDIPAATRSLKEAVRATRF
ncbi:MAG: thiamine phosphate synthase [Coriobacteriia bacterium]|nr:thiamine phosphate synthase [Coriobacteriia bacterium]